VNAGGIAEALNLRRAGAAYVGPCPACGYRGFEVRERHGTTLVRCHGGGCEQATVLAALSDMRLWARERSHPPCWVRRRPSRTPSNDDSALGVARQLWQQARPAEGSVVERYLRFRGHLGALPEALRLLPDARHTETGTRWPAMVASVRHVTTAELCAVHRTFLRPDGSRKAPVTPNKKTLGPTAGGAVQLSEASAEIAVTEGIETGLAVLGTTTIPTWAALSAGGMRRLVLPPLPLAATVTICADHDPVGIAVAHDAAERWHREGRQVRMSSDTGK
jgi:hypothetical protein